MFRMFSSATYIHALSQWKALRSKYIIIIPTMDLFLSRLDP